MTTFWTWHDFVRFTREPTRVTSEKQRLDIGVVVPSLQSGQAEVVTIERIANFGGGFEAMTVTETGNVTVWTKDKVWHLVRRKLERFLYINRHPDGQVNEPGVLGEWHDFSIAGPADFTNSAAARTAVDGLPPWSSERQMATRSRVSKQSILGPGERLDAMFLGVYGNVVVWTDRRIWAVTKDGGDELLVVVGRNPESDDKPLADKV